MIAMRVQIEINMRKLSGRKFEKFELNNLFRSYYA